MKNIKILLPLLALCVSLAGCQPALPVEVWSRPALIAGGKVATFKNTGSKTLSLVIVFENSSFNEKKEYKVVLAPGASQQIGGFDGWKVLPGETVSIRSDGYATAKFVFSE